MTSGLNTKGKENKVADALSRRPDYRNGEIKRETQMLIEKDGGLIINKDMEIKMVRYNEEEDEIAKKIKEETKRSKERPELETEEDGYKRFKGMIFVPKKSEETVIKRYHDDIREGHPGIARTMEKIQRNYKRYTKECDSCNRNKNDYRKPNGKMIVEEKAPSRPWESITVDFMEMPATKHLSKEKDELMVVMDTFSKQTILITTNKKATTEEIFYLLWERIFSVFGIPRKMLSDRDRIFKTERWGNLMKQIGARQALSTAYHQRTDGQTERKIQEIRMFFRHYLDYEQENWVALTPMVQYAINDAESSATGKTPNMITFGTTRIEGFEQRESEEGTSHEERMKIIHHEVQMDIEWNKRIMKEYYDGKRVETLGYCYRTP